MDKAKDEGDWGQTGSADGDSVILELFSSLKILWFWVIPQNAPKRAIVPLSYGKLNFKRGEIFQTLLVLQLCWMFLKRIFGGPGVRGKIFVSLGEEKALICKYGVFF